MVQCCVPFCKSTPGPSKTCSFHEFPVTMVRFEWLRRIARKATGTSNEPWRPSDRSKVCSLHFREEDFRRDLKKRRLLPNAVPSIFPGYPPEMQQTRRLSSPQKSKSPACKDVPQQLAKSLGTEERVAKSRRGRKRKRLASATSSILTENAQGTGGVSSAVDQQKAEELASGNIVTSTSLTATNRRSKRVAQNSQSRAVHTKGVEISEPVQGLVVSSASVPTASAVMGQHVQSVSSTSSAALCTQKPVADTPTSKVADQEGIAGEMVTQDKLAQSGVTTSVTLASPAVVTSTSTPPTRATSRPAVEPGKRLVQLADGSTAGMPSCKRKLVAVVPPGVKPEALKRLLLSSKLLSNAVSSCATPLTSRSVNASESKIVATCSSAATTDTVRPVCLKTPKHAVIASRVVNARRSSSGVTPVVERVAACKAAQSSSLMTAKCLGRSRHSVSSYLTSAGSSKALSQLLTPDKMVTASHPETGGKVHVRTVASQTRLNRPRLRNLCQRLKTLQRKCLKLQTHKRQLQQELSSARQEAKRAQTLVKELRLTQFQEGVASGDARCLFLEEQLRCLGQTKHRWREETLQCCLLWHTLSPRGYRLISQSGMLLLPSCSTLKRHVDAIGDGVASLREPPSPTGDTLPSIEDIDDIHQLPDIVDFHLTEPGTDAVPDGAGEIGPCIDANNTAKVNLSAETAAQDSSASCASPDLQAEGTVSSTEDASLVAGSESGQASPSGKDSLAHHGITNRFKLLAESPSAQEGEQVVQVIYTKPSDILDNVHVVDSVTPGARDTAAPTKSHLLSLANRLAVPESADELVEKNSCRDSNNAEQIDCCEPTTVFTEPSKWLTIAADKPSDCAQIVTIQTKKKEAVLSTSIKNRCRQPVVKPNVLCHRPSRMKLVSSKVRKNVSVAECSANLHQSSNSSSCTESASVAEKKADLLSEDNRIEELVSPPKDLAELLTIVGADTNPERMASAINAWSSAQGIVMNSETQQLPSLDTNSQDQAVELPVQSSPIVSIEGVIPGNDAQVLKMIYVEPSDLEGGLYETFHEVVPKATAESSGEGNQVFQILYVCTPASTEAGQ
ncbi:streptococcal hemagglutinin-like isoform X1 [Dermacentor albipictus]|uniref:streptococcal hemagglutinin-like isoform X1 n=2 Tax=Dermacentor albipictus TaxID=60249 RepID=UPI0038FC7C5A